MKLKQSAILLLLTGVLAISSAGCTSSKSKSSDTSSDQSSVDCSTDEDSAVTSGG